MINDVFDSIFKAENSKDYNMISERSNRAKPPINNAANGATVNTDKN